MTVSVQWFTITPDGQLDFSVDLSTWLGTETISTAVWTVPSPMSKVSESHTQTSATVVAKGAVYGEDYLLQCLVTMASGNKESFHVLITGART